MKKRPAIKRPLPGVNAPIPEGGSGIRGIDADAVARFLRTVEPDDDARGAHELADAWLKAAVAQLEQTAGACAPHARALLECAADQLFWSRVLFDHARAALQLDARAVRAVRDLVEIASRITDSFTANVLAAMRSARVAAHSHPAERETAGTKGTIAP